MKIFKSIILTILLLSSGLKSDAQKKVYGPLKIGDTIGDVMLTNLINHSSSTSPLTKFNQNKLLILDFWATWCGPCIGMFPKMDTLRKQLAGKVEFLSVSTEAEEKVRKFLSNMLDVKNLNVVSVSQDTTLSKLFPHQYLPFYVWIDKNGKILATTGREEITAKNIKQAIEGRINFHSIENSILKDFNAKTSVFQIMENPVVPTNTSALNRDKAKRTISYSVATGSMENAGGKLFYDSTHFSFINGTIALLYRYYYDLSNYAGPMRGAFASGNQRIFEIADTTLLHKLIYPEALSGAQKSDKKMEKWVAENAVCYEIIYPPNLSWKKKMDLIKQDLDRYFGNRLGFSTHIETRIDSMTYVLKRLDQSVELKSNGSKSFQMSNRYSYEQRNLPLKALMTKLRTYFFQGRKLSLVDGSEFVENVDLQFKADMTDLNSINKALKAYGIGFIRDVKQIDVIVFTNSRPIPTTGIGR